jgi:GT2 family glycosyltransferase
VLLSICIVNWNTCDFLRDCLSSLYLYPVRGAGGQEIIVVDNDSTDGSANMVAANFPEVTLIRNTKNAGYAEGNNQALEAAKGEYLLLLNPDVVVHKNALTRAVLYMRSNPTVGVLGARLLSRDGSTQMSLRSFPDPKPVLWQYLGLSKLFPNSRRFGAYRMTYFNYDRPGEVDQPMGTFMLISRPCFKAVGLMDTQFPIFFNEVDWCYRAKRELGWRIYYTPEVTITHFGGASTSQVRPQMVRESHQSLLKFYDKHYRASMSPLLYSVIKRAILWNEARMLKKAKPETPPNP